MATSRAGGFTVPAINIAPPPALVVPYLEASVPLETRTPLVALAVSTLHKNLPTDRDLVLSVTSLILSALPEIAGGMRATVAPPLSLQPVPEEQYWNLLNPGGMGVADPNLLPLGDQAHMDASTITEPSFVYSAVALVIFAIARQARESAPAAAEINRPRALISKFSIPEADQVILPGRDHGPSVKTLEHIFNAFSVYSGVRSQITLCLIGIEASARHYPPHIDAIMTQFLLMRNAGLTHVGAIKKFVEAHPWSVRVPGLEPYYRIFCRDLIAYGNLNTVEQKYHRLLCSQSDFLFLTADLRPLIAVAGDFLKDVEDNFKDYVYNAAKYQALVDEVRSYLSGYKSHANLASIAKALSLDDIPELPVQAAPTAKIQPPTV